jgi:hypothetical protein
MRLARGRLPVRQNGTMITVHGGVHETLDTIIVQLLRRLVGSVDTIERVRVRPTLDEFRRTIVALRHGIVPDTVPGVRRGWCWLRWR